MKPGTARSIKALAVVLLLFCLVGVYQVLNQSIMIFAGNVLIEQTDSDPILLNGNPPGAGWLALPEQIVVDAPGGVAAATRIGISCMGLLRLLACFAALLLLALTLVNVLRGRLFNQANSRMLCAAGITVTIASIMLPLLNGYAIPALIMAASDNSVAVGLDYSRSPQLWQGFALLFAAHILRAGKQED